jgi:predicted DNA-binding ribbon-helix-helix protein
MLKKHSVKIAGHATSITLESPFWDQLKRIATERDMALSTLIEDIDTQRGDQNLSSALRVFVLETVMEK